jgi:endosialidase-like protein
VGTKYSSKTVAGYNAAPPPDDGSAIASNKISWSIIKTKLPDPILSLAQAMNTALLNALDVSNTAQNTAYTTLAADHLRPIEVSGGATIHLASAASVGVGYQVTVVNTDLSLSSTVDLALAANTLDGSVAGSATLAPGQSITVAVNAAINGYYTVNRGWGRGGFIVSEPVRFNAGITVELLSRFNYYVKASSNGTFIGLADLRHEFTNAEDTGVNIAMFNHSGSTPTNQYGNQINLGGDPNNATNYFERGVGASATERYTLRSNGGLANYQANDANLCDINAKTNVREVEDHTAFVKQLAFKAFRYVDAKDDTDCIDITAQDIESIAPELITPFGDKKGVLTYRLQQRINSVIPRLIARIEALEAALAAKP